MGNNHRGLPHGRGDAPIIVPRGPLPRRNGNRPGEIGHLSPDKKFWLSVPRYHSVCFGALYSLIHSHGPPSHRAPRQDRIPYRRPRLDPQGGPQRYPELQHEQQKVALEDTLVTLPYLEVRWLHRGTKLGTCLSVPPSTFNGMELGSQEWCNSLFL